MKISTLSFTLPGLLLLAGCAEPGIQSSYYSDTSVHGATGLSARAAADAADRSLEARIRSDLNRYGDLAAVTPALGITANSGTVTITGAVQNERDRQMVETCVRNTPGVISLNDQIQVGYVPTGSIGQSTAVYAPETPPVVEVQPPVVSAPRVPAYTEEVRSAPPSSEVYIEEQARPVAPSSTGVYTDGTRAGVSLQVQAGADADRDLANRIADNVRGDAVLPGLVPNVTISVTAGRAKVTGTVESVRQRHAILEAVRHTPGVVEVHDHLHVR